VCPKVESILPTSTRISKTHDIAESLRITAANCLEASIVIDGWKNPILSHQLDELIERFNIIIEAVTAAQAKIARQAYRDFGKGRSHQAGLNFGDCFSSALAHSMREPMLHKGDDFTHTDIRPS